MAAYEEDFKEIAHCGGQATFSIRCQTPGVIEVAAGFRHSRPSPAAWVGIYAIAPHGIPIADFMMGGIGQANQPSCPDGCLPVFLGSDSHQKWGHQCPSCGEYFRNSHHPAIYPLTCPYCGIKTSAYHFLTEAQLRYVRHYVQTYIASFNTDVLPGQEREIIIDMDAISMEDDDGKRPEFYYTSETQQTRWVCECCGCFNDIRGRFGYCSSCGKRNNILTIKNSISTMREAINSNQLSPSDAVRRSVSEFDALCRDYVSHILKRIPSKPSIKLKFEKVLFHDIEKPEIADLKNIYDVDILRGLSVSDRAFVKLMMQRRHVYEHNMGVIDQNYIDKSGDGEWRVGDLLREKKENAHDLLGFINRMSKNIDDDFHEIFPLTEWPVRYYARTGDGRRSKR